MIAPRPELPGFFFLRGKHEVGGHLAEVTEVNGIQLVQILHKLRRRPR